MPKQNNFVTKDYFDEKFGKVMEKLDKFDKMSEQIDWMVGKIQGHEEEHTLLNNTVSEHSDNLEIINGKLGITI